MAQMAITLRTANFNALHSVADVAMLDDRVVTDGGKEAGPARPGFILGRAGKQIGPAPTAGIHAAVVIVVKCAGKGAFGATFTQDMELFGGQALTPFIIGEGDFSHFYNVDRIAIIFNGQSA